MSTPTTTRTCSARTCRSWSAAVTSLTRARRSTPWRARRFCEFLEQAKSADGRERKAALDRAGHLMYASHLSYTNDAMLGAPECDLIVQLVREREHEGLYGARITGGGSGGAVAVLCDTGPRADAALAAVSAEYARPNGANSE